MRIQYIGWPIETKKPTKLENRKPQIRKRNAKAATEFQNPKMKQMY